MLTLSHNDLHALNHVIREIYTARDVETFYRVVFSAIQRIIPCETLSFNDTVPSTKSIKKITFNSTQLQAASQKLLVSFQGFAPEHPLTPYIFSGDVIKITDYLSRGQFKNSEIYNEFYRHIGTESQIAFAIPVSDDRVTLLALSRSALDFTERDRLILGLLRTHLIAALQHATELERMQIGRKRLQIGIDEEQQGGALLFKRDGSVISISDYACEKLEKYFGIRVATGEHVPDYLLQTIYSKTEYLPVPEWFGKTVEMPPIIFAKDGYCLEVKLLTDELTQDLILFVAEKPDTAEQIKRLERYGLSPRESEVLFWLAQGKSNIEIAMVLGMSRRTAEKHVERILDKLGATSRSGATAMVRKEFS